MVGKTLAQISNQVVLELEFFDYLLNPIEPRQNVIVRDGTSTEYVITDVDMAHPFGHRDGSSFQVFWRVESNKMILTAAESSRNQVINMIYYFAMKQFDTTEKSYTKFKYLQ